jgi:hypothetical protein
MNTYLFATDLLHSFPLEPSLLKASAQSSFSAFSFSPFSSFFSSVAFSTTASPPAFAKWSLA